MGNATSDLIQTAFVASTTAKSQTWAQRYKDACNKLEDTYMGVSVSGPTCYDKTTKKPLDISVVLTRPITGGMKRRRKTISKKPRRCHSKRR